MNSTICVYSDNPFVFTPIAVPCTWRGEWAVHETPIQDTEGAYTGDTHPGKYSVTHRCGCSAIHHISLDEAETIAERLALLPPCPVSDLEARLRMRMNILTPRLQDWLELVEAVRERHINPHPWRNWWRWITGRGY